MISLFILTILLNIPQLMDTVSNLPFNLVVKALLFEFIILVEVFNWDVKVWPGKKSGEEGSNCKDKISVLWRLVYICKLIVHT